VIIKNIIGSGWRGLASYLSQLSKSTTTDHINDIRIPNLHQPYFAFDERARLGKPASRFNSLPSLSQRNVDGFGRHGAVLLQGDAHVGMEPGRNGGTDQLRRSGHEFGGDGQKGEPGAVAPFLTNLAGRTPREMAQEVGVLRRLRPNLTKAVSHLIIGHDPNQRELTETEWKTAIQIALKEHGAEETAFAAWIHFDTGIPHCHLMFSRVTPEGKVISDSNNFATNMRAARLIERTFMLDAPTATPAVDRLGDRQALDGASRRADRRGTPPPSKIDVKAIRAALAEARDRNHFLQLLAELRIEAEFDRRGVAREIYGWRLRRVGAAEWLKASTVAKDLSWPKIAHRFTESPVVAPAPSVEVPATTVQANSDQYSRAPAPLRQMLREHHQQRQLVATPKPYTETQATKKTLEIDLAQVRAGTQDLALLTQALALLGSACLKYALSFLKTVIGWIKKLLYKFFGIGVRETQLASGPQAVTYEPYTLDVDAHEVPNDDATQLVNQITQALKAKDAALLPEVEGRDQIAAAMLTDFADEHDPLCRLQAAGSAYLSARQAVVEANSKPPADLLVVAAREALKDYGDELEDGQLSFKRELNHIDDPVFKVQLEGKLKKAIEKFAKLPIEGGFEALQECVDLVTEVRRLAGSDQTHFPDAESGDTTAADVLTNPGRKPKTDDLDAMFSNESADAAAPATVAPEAAPAAPVKKPLMVFLEAANAFTLADSAVKNAQLKDIWYVDSRPQAQTRHDAAAAELFELEKANSQWRSEHKVAAALGADPLGFKPRAEAARARVANTTAALQKADREHAAFRIQFDNTPVPIVSYVIQDRHTAAAAALKKAQELLFSRARLNLTVLDGNPLLRQKREQFGSQIRRAETRVAAFLSDPRTQPTVVKDVDDMIRALASEVAIERARLAPRPDVEDGQDADEAGQHGFAVPGQR
jgi:Relaxase/Mobilisation nuclease domain